MTLPNDLGSATLYLLSLRVLIRKCDCFEGIRDYRSLNHGGITFPTDESTAEQK
jgi:hypothetical protein